MSKKKHGIFFKLIIVLVIVLLLVAGIIIGGYFYLKNTLGIDVLEIKNCLEFLNSDYDESEILTNVFSDSDTENAFIKLFNTNEIYFKNEDEEYIFDCEKFEINSMTNDVALTDKEIAGLMTVLMNNAENVNDSLNFLKMKQMDFIDFEQDENFYYVSIKYIVELNFNDFLNKIEKDSLDFISGLIPKKVFITSNLYFKISIEDCFDVSLVNNGYNINDLSKDQSIRIVKLLNKFLFKEVNVIDFFDSYFCQMLFGNNEYNGLMKSINGFNNIEFFVDNSKINLIFKTQ